MPPDRGDIVLGWLTRLVVSLAIVGVIGFDAISIGTARLAVQDQADDAARAASAAWIAKRDVQDAYATAMEAASVAQPTNEIEPASFSVDPDATVHLTLHRLAPTLVLRLIAPLRHLADVEAMGTGRATV